jgi:hypothetical protein
MRASMAWYCSGDYRKVLGADGEDVRGGSAAPADESRPCPFCGYDLRGQPAAREAAGSALRCPECGETVDRWQLVDRLPLLCEGRSPLLAFFLVPVDLLQLCWPRWRLTRRRRLGAAPHGRGLRVLTVGLPLWLMSAALLFVAARASITLSVTMYRIPPLSIDMLRLICGWITRAPMVGIAWALFASAFGIAALVFAATLAQRPTRAAGQLRTLAVRRAAYVFGPVFAILVVCAGVFLYEGETLSVLLDSRMSKFVLPCLAIPACMIRAGRAGFADRGGKGVWLYLGCFGLAVVAWMIWFAGLGALLTRRGPDFLLKMVYFGW